MFMKNVLPLLVGIVCLTYARIGFSQTYDAQLPSTDTVSEYTIIPKALVSPLPLGGRVYNAGTSSITNAGLKVDVYDGSMTQIYTTTSPLQTINSSSYHDVIAGNWTPPNVAGTYTLKFYPVMSEIDQGSTNDTLIQTIVISDSIYARDMPPAVGSLGIGAGNGGYLGNEFAITTSARLSAVNVFFTRGYTGSPFGAVVWDMAGGYPNNIIAYTDTLYYPDDSADYYTIPMHGGDVLLNAGNYVVTMIEFDSTLAIGLAANIFTFNRAWADWPTNPISPWGNNEDYGSSFQKIYMVRAIIHPACPPDIITGFTTTGAGCGSPDGTATVITTGTGPFTYSWNTGGTTATEAGLAIGSHIVTVTDTYTTCSETDTVTVINTSAPVIDSVGIVPPLCFGESNAIANVFVSGGTPGYHYSWSNGDTTASVTNIPSGSYNVAITDAANCQTQTFVVITNPFPVTTSTTGTDATCASCADGSALTSASGGTGGYTYSWAPSGGTNASASGLTPGTYTVTITDANGCSTASTVTIGAPINTSGIADAIGLYKTQVYPNPSQGTFNVTGMFTYEGELKMEIVNMLGAVVYNKRMSVSNQLSTSIELTVPPGIYMLRIYAGNIKTTKQLIIE